MKIGAIMGFLISLSVGLSQFSMTNLVDLTTVLTDPLCPGSGVASAEAWWDWCWEAVTRRLRPCFWGAWLVRSGRGPHDLSSADYLYLVKGHLVIRGENRQTLQLCLCDEETVERIPVMGG